MHARLPWVIPVEFQLVGSTPAEKKFSLQWNRYRRTLFSAKIIIMDETLLYIITNEYKYSVLLEIQPSSTGLTKDLAVICV